MDRKDPYQLMLLLPSFVELANKPLLKGTSKIGYTFLKKHQSLNREELLDEASRVLGDLLVLEVLMKRWELEIKLLPSVSYSAYNRMMVVFYEKSQKPVLENFGKVANQLFTFIDSLREQYAFFLRQKYEKILSEQNNCSYIKLFEQCFVFHQCLHPLIGANMILGKKLQKKYHQIREFGAFLQFLGLKAGRQGDIYQFKDDRKCKYKFSIFNHPDQQHLQIFELRLTKLQHQTSEQIEEKMGEYQNESKKSIVEYVDVKYYDYLIDYMEQVQEVRLIKKEKYIGLRFLFSLIEVEQGQYFFQEKEWNKFLKLFQQMLLLDACLMRIISEFPDMNLEDIDDEMGLAFRRIKWLNFNKLSNFIEIQRSFPEFIPVKS